MANVSTRNAAAERNGIAFAESLQRRAAPHRPDRAAEALDRARRALHAPLLVAARRPADQARNRRMAEPDAERQRHQRRREHRHRMRQRRRHQADDRDRPGRR